MLTLKDRLISLHFYGLVFLCLSVVLITAFWPLSRRQLIKSNTERNVNFFFFIFFNKRDKIMHEDKDHIVSEYLLHNCLSQLWSIVCLLLVNKQISMFAN